VSVAGTLLLGLGLGLQHATEPDHVVVVSSLLGQGTGARRASRVAAWWGVGHAISVLGVGAVIVALRPEISPTFERIAGLAVAALLVGVGLVNLARAARAGEVVRDVPEQGRGVHPSMFAGIVHGLAGSAGLALLALSTIGSRALASAYLVAFAVGAVFGMVALTWLLARPLAWSLARPRVARWVLAASGVVSLSLAVGMALE
jgi:nickel/cobalt exporter